MNLGKYGLMAMNNLKENEKSRYLTLQSFGMLEEKMHQVDEEANQLLDTLIADYLEKNKPQNPNSTMEMWNLREQAWMQAEEIVKHQVIYKFH